MAIDRSGLFDANWYRERYLEAAAWADPVAHYLAVGAAAGHFPHPLFQSDWYRLRYPEADAAGLTPLGHFILQGEADGAWPSVLFDPDWYRQHDPSLTGKRQGLFLHFLQTGAVRGLSPHPAFDPAFYRGVAKPLPANVNPLTHFVEFGARNGLPPNPFFDPPWYTANLPGSEQGAINPLVHFLIVGAAEGRSPHPDVDLRVYQAAHPACPADPVAAYLYLLAHESAEEFLRQDRRIGRAEIHRRLAFAGLFEADSYLKLNDDLPAGTDAAVHFVKHGLPQGRRFTTAASVARLLSILAPELEAAQRKFLADAGHAQSGDATAGLAGWFVARNVQIGVFVSAVGNFYMAEIAELLVWGLQALGIGASLRDETARRDEPFDLRVFVAPHEFFTLGRGRAWRDAAGAPNSVLYNVEQVQTQWFCRSFQTLMQAPLLLDINFQSSEILRHLGCEVVHFMPGHLPASPYAVPQEHVSDIELARGYPFARQRFNWMERDRLDDRPIDVLFVGSGSPRRDTALERLLDLTDTYRFCCVYTKTSAPMTTQGYRTTSSKINCALAQRAKIVLNIHRDWLGYFEWSRIVMQGFWQGACVVTDPNLPHPIFQAGVHFQEESTRHLGELIRWLLGTADGRSTLDATRRAGFVQARGLGSMPAALAPVLGAFQNLLSR
jgi:hypothetical protein